MKEHDDDLESTVHESADEETDSFPNTEEELNDREGAQEADDEPPLDPDATEL